MVYDNKDAATQAIAIVDFGSQYSRLIAKCVRQAKVFCKIISHDASKDTLSDYNIKGIILSGGPNSVLDSRAPKASDWIFQLDVPILGICYGMQIITKTFGGRVAQSSKQEYGKATVNWKVGSELIAESLGKQSTVWMSHGDRIETVPNGFSSIASSSNSPIAAIRYGNIYGIQFHPEVAHTEGGTQIIRNFLFNICQCLPAWTPVNFIEQAISSINKQVGNGKVICALSGGVDSAVAATLIHKAIGSRLHCIFVDNGLLRKDEAKSVFKALNKIGINLRVLDESESFIALLKGTTNPEEKRITIGQQFIRIFEREKDRIQDVDYLAQGTLYPDVIESKTQDSTASHKIKTHHNVGGLPKNMNMKLIEPLRYLFKDEVRQIGLELGLPRSIVDRHPFPGPGLAIRIIGEVRKTKLEILRACDAIVLEEVIDSGIYAQLWQAFAVLTDTKTVGVMGDQRTYRYVVAIRMINSTDAMTANWFRVPYGVIEKISNRIVNEVSAINRVVYDVTSKPPGTIEWE